LKAFKRLLTNQSLEKAHKGYFYLIPKYGVFKKNRYFIKCGLRDIKKSNQIKRKRDLSKTITLAKLLFANKPQIAFILLRTNTIKSLSKIPGIFPVISGMKEPKTFLTQKKTKTTV
jgi:hypothetical protein